MKWLGEIVAGSAVQPADLVCKLCLLQVKDAVEQKALEFDFVNFAVGFIVSAIVGICAIKMVNWLVKSDKFKVFAIYTFILGIAVIGIGIFEHSVGMNIVEYFK